MLEDASEMVFLCWDMNYFLFFYFFLHSSVAEHKLSPEGVTGVYIGS